MKEQWSGLYCHRCHNELSTRLARTYRGYCPDCGQRLHAGDGQRNAYPVLHAIHTQRIVTRLRFEPGVAVPQVGDTFLSHTVFGGQLTRVKVLEIRGTFQHTDGATLVDARVRQSRLAAPGEVTHA